METTLKVMKREIIFLGSVLRLQLLIVLVFIAAWPISNAMMALAGAIMGLYMFTYSVQHYQEGGRSENWILSMPVTRIDVCKAKYLMGLVYTLVVTLITNSMVIIGGFIGEEDPNRVLYIEDIWANMAMIFFIGMGYLAVTTPLIIKFGAEKMRYIMVGVAVVVMAGEHIWTEVLSGNNLNFTINEFWAGICCILMYGLSYVISKDIYEKQDFR